MNHIIINKLTDLQKVIEKPFYISGQQSLVTEETYNNMWALTFSKKLIKKIEIKDLETFLLALLKNRVSQLFSIDAKLRATFYLWFDKQALQLRFNIISIDTIALLFGCKLNILHSPESILSDFIKTTRHIAIEGEYIEFFNHAEDIDDKAEEEYTLDVYTKSFTN